LTNKSEESQTASSDDDFLSAVTSKHELSSELESTSSNFYSARSFWIEKEQNSLRSNAKQDEG